MVRSRQLLPCPEDCPSRMYAFMVECWHEIPGRRPSFAEIHNRLRHWEGFSSAPMAGPTQGSLGYQASTTSHSMCNQSQHSGSHHSSTGPSNNTGSTGLSQQQQFHNQYHPQFMHVQMSNGANMLVGAYGGQGQMGPPQGMPPGMSPQQQGMPPPPPQMQHHPNQNCQTGSSIASLQMV